MIVLYLFNELVNGERTESNKTLLVGNINSVQWTYGNLRLQNDSADFDLQRVNEEAVFYNGTVWGDFRVISLEEAKKIALSNGDAIEPLNVDQKRLKNSIGNFQKRLMFIVDDLINIERTLREKNIDLAENNKQGVGLNTYINNIEAACDLNSDEINHWKLNNPKEVNEFFNIVEEKEEEDPKVKAIIDALKEMEVDGETMQHILSKVGMESQMLKQLVMTSPLDEVINHFEERKTM
jgi:hypothetical protein